MKDFNIKELLIHILHGGIILFVVYFSFKDTQCIEQIASALRDNNGVSAFGTTLLVVLSYLIGLFLDPVADLLDTYKFGDIIPSYYLLRDGKCKSRRIRSGCIKTKYIKCKNVCYCEDVCNCGCKCKNECKCKGLRLAHYAIIRSILINDVEENDAFIQDDKKREVKENKTDLWKDKNKAMLLFNYAKNRAFACASTYQLERIEAYHRLFIFYRNMMLTTFISAIILIVYCFRLPDWYRLCCFIPIIAGILFIFLFYKMSYKYRTYYCRMILGAVYSPAKKIINN